MRRTEEEEEEEEERRRGRRGEGARTTTTSVSVACSSDEEILLFALIYVKLNHLYFAIVKTLYNKEGILNFALFRVLLEFFHTSSLGRESTKFFISSYPSSLISHIYEQNTNVTTAMSTMGHANAATTVRSAPLLSLLLLLLLLFFPFLFPVDVVIGVGD